MIFRSCKIAEELSFFRGLTPSFQVIFHVIYCIFNRNEDFTKKTDSENLEISQKSIYDGVFFSKVTNPQRSECTFARKRTHHRHFLEHVPKTSYHKRSLIKLQPYSTQPTILSKKWSSCKTFL